MKKLQSLYNNDANKIIKEAAQEKKMRQNLNFLTDLAMVAGDTKPTEDEHQTINKTRDHKILES